MIDYRPRQPASMVGWFEAKRAGGFPVIGVAVLLGAAVVVPIWLIWLLIGFLRRR